MAANQLMAYHSCPLWPEEGVEWDQCVYSSPEKWEVVCVMSFLSFSLTSVFLVTHAFGSDSHVHTWQFTVYKCKRVFCIWEQATGVVFHFLMEPVIAERPHINSLVFVVVCSLALDKYKGGIAAETDQLISEVEKALLQTERANSLLRQRCQGKLT